MADFPVLRTEHSIHAEWVSAWRRKGWKLLIKTWIWWYSQISFLASEAPKQRTEPFRFTKLVEEGWGVVTICQLVAWAEKWVTSRQTQESYTHNPVPFTLTDRPVLTPSLVSGVNGGVQLTPVQMFLGTVREELPPEVTTEGDSEQLEIGTLLF